MKIGLINEFFPPFAPGGAEWSMSALANAMAAKGHQVVVMTPNYGAQPFEQSGRVRIYRYPFAKKMKQGSRLPGFLWHANPFFYLHSAYQIWKIAQKEKLDLLHVQNKYSLIGTSWAARFLNIPVVATIRDTSYICRISVCLQHHDTVPNDCSLKKLLAECSEEYYEHYYEQKNIWVHAKDKLAQTYHWFDVHWRRWHLNRADAVIGVSNGILETHGRSGIFRNQKSIRRAVYNLQDEIKPLANGLGDQLRQKYGLGRNRIVLYVGKFSRGKGTRDFVESFEIVSKQCPNTVYVMAGSGMKIAGSDQIKVLNQLPHAEVLDLMAIADLIVVPSVWPEPLSRVLLEALYLSKPIVGTRVGGTPEVVADGENGFLVPRSQPEKLAEAISRILSDDSLAKRMGKRSREIALTKFEKSALVRQYEIVYQDCMNQTQGGRL